MVAFFSKLIKRLVLFCMLFFASLSCSQQMEPPADNNQQETSNRDNIVPVGPNRQIKTLSEAAKIVSSGAVIEIDAGVYGRGAVVWRQDNLTIRGLNRPHIKADGAQVEDKGTWVIKGNNIVIENMEFSGARVPEGNGAAIRFEGTNLTLRDCYIHDNQNGFLCGENPSSTITFEACEFANNGSGDGFTHNIYVGRVGRFELKCSYVHHANIGHNVKSRALESHILYNRIMDETDGNSSYAIDLPNGGFAVVMGNSLQQGPRTDNTTIVCYGAEGQTHPTNELYVINNTLVNTASDGFFVSVLSAPEKTWIINNLFAGPGTLSAPNAQIKNNLTDANHFVNSSEFDYRLLPDSPAIDAGIQVGQVRGLQLTPEYFYKNPATCDERIIVRNIDIGAFEYTATSSVGAGH